MNFIKDNHKYIGIIGCIFMIIGIFLPFVTSTTSIFGYSQSTTLNLLTGNGIFILFMSIIAGILIVLNHDKFSIIPVGINFVITVYSMVNVKSIVGETLSFGKINYKIGAWLILFGIFLSFFSIVVSLLKNKFDKKN